VTKVSSTPLSEICQIVKQVNVNHHYYTALLRHEAIVHAHTTQARCTVQVGLTLFRMNVFNLLVMI